MNLASDVKARILTLGRRKDPWNPLWQELAEMYLPGKAHFTAGRQEGERDNADIYDSTPRRAARELSSSIDGLIKPKTSNWFEPVFEDEELSEKPAVKKWLEAVQDKMWRAIYRTDARFIQRSSEVDTSLVVHGWGCLWISENRARNGLLFRSFHNKDIAIDEDADGKIDTIGLNEWLTARQALARFGESKLHQNIKEVLRTEDKFKDKRFLFSQLTIPQTDRLAGKLGSESMAYQTVVLDVTNEQIMFQGGFNEFPAAIPRWDTEPGQVYPRSPGMIALPDALTLQAISKTLLIGGERAADPPLMVPSDAFLSPVRTYPGGLSVFDVQALADSGLQTPVFPLPTSNALPVGREMQADYRFQVEAAFYKNVLTLGQEGIQTATEVLERKEEFIRALGPIFGRLEADYIGVTVERVFAIMDRAGAFPERPPETVDARMEFRFQSPLQQARKAIDVAGLNRTLEVTAGLTANDPSLLDNINGDKVMRDSPQWSGIPSDWLRTEEEVAEMRGARNQGEQQAAEMDSLQPVADSLKSVAQAQQIASQVPEQTI